MRTYGRYKLTFILFFLAVIGTLIFMPAGSLRAQSEKYASIGWQLRDLSKDHVYGASIDRCYEHLLPGTKRHAVIIAIIDTGLDSTQEDLQGKLWTNPGEIPGNGIDDDHNGYVDDVHGWNFLGGPNGKNLVTETYEIYREYYRLRQPQYASASPDAAINHAYREKVKGMFLRDSLDAVQNITRITTLLVQMRRNDSVLQQSMHQFGLTEKIIRDFFPVTYNDSVSRQTALTYFSKYGIDPSRNLEDYIAEAAQYLRSIREGLEEYQQDPEAARKKLIGDDVNDISDTRYGNNNIAAGKSVHGTHVTGIIAATRGNGIGMDGIDDQASIMMLRAVPERGDERDKDIALAIRYAVNNGARIINMSFEKPLSPRKQWVDDAVRYAEEKGVLIIHAAGNNKSDLDSVDNFPSPVYLSSHKKATNFITVGASGGGPDSMILSRISNYGGRQVDLFAPGVAIYSTLPENQYRAFSGTSFATAVVSGVAGLLLSLYPSLDARQVKDILMRSVTKSPALWVKPFRGGKSLLFSGLSVSGGIINAYDALLLAAAPERAGRVQ